MTNFESSTCFLKGLKNNDHVSQAPPTANSENITMLQCIRWVLKEYGMTIEIKRADIVASTLMNFQLVKYDRKGNPVKTNSEVAISDHRIEKGLFELEKKIMEHANIKPSNGLDSALVLLRKNELSLPSHNDLRNEIVMNGHSIRIGYIGIDPTTKKDLFGGILLFNDKIVVTTEPQKRMGYVLDSLENALFAKRRAVYRKAIGEHMLRASDSDDAE